MDDCQESFTQCLAPKIGRLRTPFILGVFRMFGLFKNLKGIENKENLTVDELWINLRTKEKDTPNYP